MSIWSLLLIIACAGAVGGLINALLSDNGFVLPRTEKINNGNSIIRPGFIGNVLIGAISAAISWGLYGPMAYYVIAGSPNLNQNPVESSGITLSSLVGAVLVGVGGARWLTNEVDKTLLKVAASEAASKVASSSEEKEEAKKIVFSSPSKVLNIVRYKVGVSVNRI
ncbi:hypothetical protein [Nostoc parmelioides]|uniref:Uncharacterized protein n=1 Tax=Nostoc parmelioides FACHB-3921 TaxID=2692909 RepID=A0ABR8BPP1_9NOSO|nr:hypothetical protein [Nostoc parmelioides]MBD2255510.1 hypothetical protein [Nostoc parmelioides FACHB-3921]